MTTCAAITAAYRSGAATPATVADRFVAAGPTSGPLHAFRASDAADVRRQAAESAARLEAGTPLGPLEGIPVGVKDFLAVDGYTVHAGTRDLSFDLAGDATVVERLRRAGALLVGITEATELGLSPTGMSGARPTPSNPHSPAHLTGGSSSGTGAAIAAGLVPLGVGSDGGGSIRIPSALCGIFGLKPSWGLVPTGGEAPVGWWSVEHVGPMARCTEDLVVMLSVMADLEVSLSDAPLRFGVDWTWWGRPDPEVDAACRAVVAELGPTDVRLEHVGLASIAGYVTAVSELTAGVWDVWSDEPDRLSADVRAVLASAPAISGADYVRAQQVRRLLAEDAAAAFQRVDVILVPTTAIPAPPRPSAGELTDGVIDLDLVDALTAYTFPANLCGLPAASVPIGVTRDGRPIGLQVIGARGADATVLSACAALERAGLAASPRSATFHELLSPVPDPARST